VIEIAADDHQLILAGADPVAVIDREAFACQVEDMAPLALVEPENALGAEDGRRQLVVEEILEFAQGKRPITSE